MGILAEQVDHVIGVDTHRDSHSAAVVAARTGAVVLDRTVPADAFGYKRLLRFAKLNAAVDEYGSDVSKLTADTPTKTVVLSTATALGNSSGR